MLSAHSCAPKGVHGAPAVLGGHYAPADDDCAQRGGSNCANALALISRPSAKESVARVEAGFSPSRTRGVTWRKPLFPRFAAGRQGRWQSPVRVTAATASL